MACDTRYFCDRCSERIQPSDRFSYKPTTGGKRHEPCVDLCGACEAAFRGWLGPRVGCKPQPTPTEAAPAAA